MNAFNRLVEIEPNSAEIWYNKANVHYELDEYGKAIECLEKSLKIEPNFENAKKNLVIIKDYIKSINKITKLVKCEYCGTEISEEDEFCNHCGAVLNNRN